MDANYDPDGSKKSIKKPTRKWYKIAHKMSQKRGSEPCRAVKNAPKSRPGGVLCGSWGPVGPSWRRRCVRGGVLGPSWGLSGAVMVPVGGVYGELLGVF